MRKLYYFLLVCTLLLVQNAIAQTNIASYHFNSSIGTYSPITGTAVFTGTWDGEISGAIPLGGTFTYGGVNYTTCYITANGWIGFGTSAPTSTSTPLSSTAGTPGGIISAYGNDGANSTATGSAPVVSYANIGGPTGEFVVQFQDHARYSNRATERLNFQIRLNLATGVVQIVYGPFTPSGSTATTSQVGIRGNSTTWTTNVNNLMIDNIPAGTSCNWTNPVTGNANSSTMLYTSANPGLSIPNGLTYTWKPQSVVAPVRTFAAVSGITSSGATISWTAPTGATTYNVQYRPLGSCAWMQISNNATTSVSLTGLNPATVYQVRVQAVAATDSTIWSHIPNQAGTGNGYTTTGTFTTTGIPTDLQALQLQTPATNNIGCYTSAVPVTIRLRNAGTTAIDFSANNATVSGAVTGPNPATFTPVVISSGTLAAGATQDVVLTPTYNMSAAGTYTFSGYAKLATPDTNPSNDTIASRSFTTQPAATLPQLVTFSGYAGTPATLGAAFPGWTEGTGSVTPTFGGDGSFTNTSSASQTGFYGAAAKINLYGAVTGWVISPKFVPTANHKFKYKIAVVNYASTTAADLGTADTVKAMISTDCGATWITLREFTSSNTNGVDASSNVLRAFEEDLAAYAGQTVIAAIYARRTSGLSPDIDVVIDDMAIDVVTTCFPPTDLLTMTVGTTTADIMWNPPTAGTPANYQVYYSTTNVEPNAATVPTISGIASNQANLTGLTSGTMYYLWVRSNCGTDTSAWSTVLIFPTNCVPIATPTATAETFATYLPSICWSEAAGPVGGPFTSTTTSNWIQDDFANVVANGKSARLNLFGTTADEWLISPAYDLGAGGNMQLEFDMAYTVYSTTSPAVLGADDKIIVLISTDDGASWNPLREWNSGTPPISNTGEPVFISLLGYNGLVKFAFYGESTVSNVDNEVFIDNIAVKVIPTCPEPTSIVFFSITSSGATVEWTAPLSAPSSYQLYYATTNTAPDGTTTPQVTGISGTSTNLTGLSPQTTYFVWVRSNCGASGFSDWSAVKSFKTACSEFTAPFTQSFSTGVLPECWTNTSSNPVANGLWKFTGTVDHAIGNTRPNGTFAWTDGSDPSNINDVTLTSPLINLTGLSDPELVFDMFSNNDGTYANNILNVEVNNGTGWQLVFTDNTSSTQWRTIRVPLTPYINSTIQVRFVFDKTAAPSGNAFYNDILVDEVNVRQTPTCLRPTDPLISNVTSSGATIDWTSSASGPSSYELYHSTNNTAPVAATTPQLTGITGTTTNITGLTPQTQYYVWVRSNCGAAGVSEWSVISTFTTACAPVNAPFAESFSSGSLPACWTNTSSNTVANGLWKFAGTVDYATGNTRPNGTFAWVDGSDPSTINDVTLITPLINLTGLANPELVFDYFSNNTNTYPNNIFTVEVNDGTGWQSVFTDNTSSNQWRTTTIALSQYINATIQVRFVVDKTAAPAGFAFYNDILLDDVKVRQTPTCVRPTDLLVSNITTSGATIDWTPSASGPSSYELYYSTSNTAPVAATTPQMTGITGTTTNITGLTPQTPYYVWVRSNCGAAGMSEWSNQISFTTNCAAVTTPTAAVETFDTYLPSICWSEAAGPVGGPFTSTTTSNWIQDDFANVVANGKSARLNIYSTTADEWLITPVYDLGTGVNLELKFDMAYTEYATSSPAVLGSDDKIIVFISTDNGANWNPLREWNSSTPAISHTGEPVAISLTGYSGLVRFAFYGESTVSNEDNEVFIDNVSIGVMSSLPVTLVDFKGVHDLNKNVLSWATVSEQNSKHFELQRSVDGLNFSTIAQVESKAVNGNSNSRLAYSYVDANPIAATNYYRLKQVDKDNKWSLSKVVRLQGGRSQILQLQSVYPVPAKNVLNVVLEGARRENVTITVVDMYGKQVLHQQQSVETGSNLFDVRIDNLPAGNYMLRINSAVSNGVLVHKFMKQ